MKLLTTNFLTCAVKACKTSPNSFPLHFRDAVLERSTLSFNPLFIRNILPRVQWDALRTTATELGLAALVPDDSVLDGLTQLDAGHDADPSTDEMAVEQSADEKQQQERQQEETLKKLHNLLLETAVMEGKLVCANCGFEYPIKEGVGNFLLPAHLV